jgi:hypothetical protein
MNWSWPIVRYYFGNYFEGLSKIYQTVGHDRIFSGLDLNPGPSDYNVRWVSAI